MSDSEDVGPPLLKDLFQLLQIDPKWSTWQQRGFTWWGYGLSQRVWAESPLLDFEVPVVRVHVETDVLRDVSGDRKFIGILANLNAQQVLSALVWYPSDRRVCLHSTMFVHEGIVDYLRPLLGSTVALQTAQAHLQVYQLATLLGGNPYFSSHPKNGRRPYPDDMLNVIHAIYVPRGGRVSAFDEAAFSALLQEDPHPWVLAAPRPTGFDAVLPCVDEPRATLSAPEGTAGLHATNEPSHPLLGTGLLLWLALPAGIRPPRERVAELSWRLNLAETQAWNRANLLGAWCAHPSVGLAFAAFLPSLLHTPGTLGTFAWAMGTRARWVAGILPTLGPDHRQAAERPPRWAFWRH